MSNNKFYKENKTDSIWWVDTIGERRFLNLQKPLC